MGSTRLDLGSYLGDLGGLGEVDLRAKPLHFSRHDADAPDFPARILRIVPFNIITPLHNTLCSLIGCVMTDTMLLVLSTCLISCYIGRWCFQGSKRTDCSVHKDRICPFNYTMLRISLLTIHGIPSDDQHFHSRLVSRSTLTTQAVDWLGNMM